MAIDYTKRPTAATPPAATPPAGPAGQSASPGTSPVSGTGRVVLTKSAPRVSLSKQGSGSGNVRVNLNWSARPDAPAAPEKKGFMARLNKLAEAGRSSGIDLDLGALFELADGRKGVIQALGNSFGALGQAPWIALDGDDRSGSSTGGENMTIELVPGRFKRILIFAMIYDGVPNWAAADGIVTLTPVSGSPIEVRLDATSDSSRICAVAQLLDQGGEVVVQREVAYVDGGQSALDKAYGWGMQWAPGRK
jgi:tellurite resistance protein TerA